MSPKPPKQPKTPAGMSREAGKWWREVVENWVLDEHHRKILSLACQAWDRCQQARAILDKEGLTYMDGDKPRSRPEVSVERDSRLAFARLVRELCLDDNEPPSPRLPRSHGRKD